MFGMKERLKSYYLENSPCQDFQCDDFIDDRKSSFFDKCIKLSVFDNGRLPQIPKLTQTNNSWSKMAQPR